MQDGMTWLGSKRIKRLCRIKGIKPIDFDGVAKRIVYDFLLSENDEESKSEDNEDEKGV